MILNNVECPQARRLFVVCLPRRIVFEEGSGIARFVEKQVLEPVQVLVRRTSHRQQEGNEVRSYDPTKAHRVHAEDYTGQKERRRERGRIGWARFS